MCKCFIKHDKIDITEYYPLIIKNCSMMFHDESDGTELDESKWPYAKTSGIRYQTSVKGTPWQKSD